MFPQLPNPFNVTKAMDLSDDQIDKLWVDLPGGHNEIGNPGSPMPMLISGGKGSGKTHLMRHYSFALQKIRAKSEVSAAITHDKYLGIYFLCGALNAGRFSGKNFSREVWRSVFAYYLELWLAQHCLDVLQEFLQNVNALNAENEAATVEDLLSCFDRQIAPRCSSISAFRSLLVEEQKAIDLAVNNCPLSGKLDIIVSASPGKLVFGIPQVFWRRFSEWRDTRVVYLIDEFENFTLEQQRYVHTLLRERQEPCTFKVGGRIYGFKTTKTFCADEENKEGSEFERLSLDSRLRKTQQEYDAFAVRLCIRRLAESGYSVPGADAGEAEGYLRTQFIEFKEGITADDELAELLGERTPENRPYFHRLRQQLIEGYAAGTTVGIRKPSQIDLVLASLGNERYPLLEKLNCLLLYRAWDKGQDLLESAHGLHGVSHRFVTDRSSEKAYGEVLAHFKSDLIAQVYRDCRKRHMTLGLKTFIAMSDGLPRNLLITLKLIFKWAIFYGEQPFRGDKISARAQRAGILEAAEWFFEDARGPGADGQRTRNAVSRIARLFREIRFSDKPSECSLCTFSTDYDNCEAETRDLLDLAEQGSYLIRLAAGGKDKNSKRVDRKYQLNGMLAPHWDLPLSRRGTLSLRSEEVDTIFITDRPADFEQLIENRVKPMTAPFFNKKGGSAPTPTSSEQRTMFGGE